MGLGADIIGDRTLLTFSLINPSTQNQYSIKTRSLAGIRAKLEATNKNLLSNTTQLYSRQFLPTVTLGE
jgi:hypothetical protein